MGSMCVVHALIALFAAKRAKIKAERHSREKERGALICSKLRGINQKFNELVISFGAFKT